MNKIRASHMHARHYEVPCTASGIGLSSDADPDSAQPAKSLRCCDCADDPCTMPQRGARSPPGTLSPQSLLNVGSKYAVVQCSEKFAVPAIAIKVDQIAFKRFRRQSFVC
jgi:hypothetical protein